MSNLPEGIFITGTDTGVGKTVITAALSWNLARAGMKVAVMKPVQTGTALPGPIDIEYVETVLGVKYDLDDVCMYRFPDPLSPFAASTLAGVEIDTAGIIKAFRKLSANCDTVLVEGAGGLLVPIKENYMMADLASELGLPVLVVARPGLGTLNHTALTIESARTRGLDVLGIVINGFTLSPGIAERTNPREIARMTGTPILGVFPSDPSLSVEEGRTGRIRELAQEAFVPRLGGTFDFQEFLERLR